MFTFSSRNTNINEISKLWEAVFFNISPQTWQFYQFQDALFNRRKRFCSSCLDWKLVWLANCPLEIFKTNSGPFLEKWPEIDSNVHICLWALTICTVRPIWPIFFEQEWWFQERRPFKNGRSDLQKIILIFDWILKPGEARILLVSLVRPVWPCKWKTPYNSGMMQSTAKLLWILSKKYWK